MEIKRAAADAARQMLTPIARLLMRLGGGFAEFHEIAKEAWVDVALRDYGLRGRPTNISRVAMLTGLSRKEAARIRDQLHNDEPAAPDTTHPLARILSGWHQDPDFSRYGQPLELPVQGEKSLEALLLRYGGALPTTALRKELLRVGAIALEDDRARALVRYYMPAELAPPAVRRYGSVLADLGDTLNHNVLGDDPKRPRFEGRAINVSIPAQHLDAFRQWVEPRAEGLLERTDDWLSAHEAAGGECRLGLGIYLICAPEGAAPPASPPAAGRKEDRP